MSWFRPKAAKKVTETKEQRWLRKHPYDLRGSTEYWVQAMNRAYELGEVRAAAERDKLLALSGPQPPRPFTAFPDWFSTLWCDHLASYNDDCRLRMPYYVL